MPDLRSALTALLLVTVLAGCSDDTSSTATATGGTASTNTTPTPTSGEPSPATSSEPEDPGEVIPDGNYAKTVTVAEAKERGITDRGFLSDEFGEDGETSYVFKFAGDRWTIFVGNEVPEPGDGGTLAYDAKDKIAITSESEGCPGCVYGYDWSLVGDELTLKLVGHESTDTPEGVVMVRFVTEGVFTRQP